MVISMEGHRCRHTIALTHLYKVPVNGRLCVITVNKISHIFSNE